MNRKNKVKIIWSPALSYAVGIISTDGNLSPDGRHINITSKDKNLILQTKKALGIDYRVGRKSRSFGKNKKYYVLQFGDKNFYEFLLSIGLTPAKSKIISSVLIPKKYFYDFLRGCFDGDGNINVSYHPQSTQPQLRVRLASASKNFLIWIKHGWIYTSKKQLHMLSFGKNDSIKILRLMYYKKVEFFLKRKYNIASGFIGRVA